MASVAGSGQFHAWTQIQGGAKFCDKTDGRTHVVYHHDNSRHSRAPFYEVFVDEKKLIFSATDGISLHHPNFLLRGSKTIKATLLSKGIVKITEKDSRGKNKYYVDTNRVIEGIAYDVFNYKPKKQTLDDALDRLDQVRQDFPRNKVFGLAYNQHGVCMAGTNRRGRLILFWAKPGSKDIMRIRTLKNEAQILSAQDRDGFFIVHYNKDTRSCTINDQPAILVE